MKNQKKEEINNVRDPKDIIEKYAKENPNKLLTTRDFIALDLSIGEVSNAVKQLTFRGILIIKGVEKFGKRLFKYGK